jgi:predicted DNA-binding protein (UPF0251 family)
MEQIDAIAEELDAISERLNDAAMMVLSEAIERGETSRPAIEKRISQARRAVEKAAHHLRND